MGKGPHSTGIAATVRSQVLKHPQTYWRPANFKNLPAGAVAQTFTRLADQGLIQRVAKGTYYVPGTTVFGSSVPTTTDIAAHTLGGALHPTGVTAANILGLTTQNSARGEYATTLASVPAVLRGAHVTTKRSRARASLRTQEGALLEVLRDRARHADLDASAVVERLGAVVKDRDAFRRLSLAAVDEPPRVRAMLGALAQHAGVSEDRLAPLRSSLNPLSRFDFGPLATLPHAREWQAM